MSYGFIQYESAEAMANDITKFGLDDIAHVDWTTNKLWVFGPKEW